MDGGITALITNISSTPRLTFQKGNYMLQTYVIITYTVGLFKKYLKNGAIQIFVSMYNQLL